jgi:beta-lactamase regulating signal transducer with metallopeptidase domain
MIAWMLDAMVAATLLMVLVLAVRRPVAELFGAGWAYALWLLPLLVPLLPPMPSLLPIAAAPVTIIIPELSMHDAVATAAAASQPTGSAELLWTLLAIWAGGAVAFGAWQQSTYSAFMLHLGPEGRSAEPPSFGGIRVVESDAVDGPVAVGLFQRRIVVPLDFLTRYSDTERRLALEHELVHHRRLDLLWNWIGLGFLTLNWFNPIVHIAFRAFRADQELACDAAVTRRAPSQRHDYACALVKSASHPGLVAVCPLNHADMLKRRLRMMKKHRASWTRNAGGAATLGLVGATGLALASPGFAEQSRGHIPVDVVVAAKDRSPIIAPAEIQRLREKCGGGERKDAPIVCSDDESRDPEVRAIVEGAKKKAKARVADARLSVREATVAKAQVEKSTIAQQDALAQAREALRESAPAAEAQKAARESLEEASEAMSHHHEARAVEIEKALAQARSHLHRVQLDRSRMIRATMVRTRIHLPHGTLNADHRRRIEAAIERANKRLGDVHLVIDNPIDEEALEREIERKVEEALEGAGVSARPALILGSDAGDCKAAPRPVLAGIPQAPAA